MNGAPDGWFPPGPPLSFCGYEPKTDLGAPGVEDIDNPGMWNLYLFEARYGVVKENGKKGVDGNKEKAMHEYLGHFTPAFFVMKPETG